MLSQKNLIAKKLRYNIDLKFYLNYHNCKCKSFALIVLWIRVMNKKNFIIKSLLGVLTALIFSVPVFAIEDHDEHAELFHSKTVSDGTVLSVKDCVALAYKNSPIIKRKKYELDIAKSNVGIAKSGYFPVIGAGVGFNYERNSDSVYYDKRYRDLPYVGVTVNQLVYDFGKTNADIKMEKFYEIGAEFEFVDSLCHTLFDIKAKYYNLLRKSALLFLAKKDVELNREIVKISKGKADLTTAEVYSTDAEIKLIEAEKEFNNAKYNLSNTMYLDNHINYLVQNTPTFDYDIDEDLAAKDFKPFKFSFKKEDAPEIAYKNSPDLQVIINTKNAMEQALKHTKRSFMPDLTAGAGYGLNNTYQTTNNNLRVGVGLSTDVNIKGLKHSIDVAKSEVDIADNEIILFKKDLYYEVQRALNNLDRTQEQLPSARKEVVQALKNLNFIKNAYKTKELDYTALQNARKDYINAQERYISSLYDYNMAVIQIEMAMHYHIADIQHDEDHTLHHHIEELIENYNEMISEDKKHSKKKKGIR